MPTPLLNHDIAEDRDRARRRRVYRWAAAVIAVEVWFVLAPLLGLSPWPTLPRLDPMLVVVVIFFGGMLALAVGTQVLTGRSPHLTYRPEQVDVRLDDVIGIDPILEDVRRTIDLFQAHRRFADQMGGTPRRGVLFEGLPGTGKTMTAKAMAAEAGVPFLFVSATSFQSMYYGATAKKIRAYFQALRDTARKEGGAIGFIEEIDAIAMRRGGLLSPSVATSSADGAARTVVNQVISEGTGGVVNELLVQMQSFDQPTRSQRLANRFIAAVNLLLPGDRQIPQQRPTRAPILLIAATNRADHLDPALLRPGRFDRRLTFPTPDVHGRRALVDHFLAKRAHDADLDEPRLRERIAAATNGWTPVMVEHLLDEALVNAVRRGASGMSYADVERARLTEMVGIGAPVTYTRHEQELIATHEAGHTVTAWLVAPNRTLEVVTIIKRGAALGLLAHSDTDEIYTHTSADLRALVQIAMGGMVAEELFFGDTTTGPASDLAAATRTAVQMVGAAGMTGSLVSFMAGGKDLVEATLADPAARAQVERVLEDARKHVVWLLSRNRHLVEALRDALLEHHELVGDQITDVLLGASGARRRVDGRTDLGAAAPVEPDVARPA
ncbi:AAA family ATPase [Actinotalea sp. M2MS4P-6]|uniref:AAA family ATPase n=1 Tax=Actinotalea sp. M2MS4P-6 TaxID=2983762 RepID=UPI0021E44784|nr:AAA family ATPase [Actinotalea sp. M2MS4P-6]MCV2394771.1 AAA family ATPase [Actinotalea sp. M2MS4P-6]